MIGSGMLIVMTVNSIALTRWPPALAALVPDCTFS